MTEKGGRPVSRRGLLGIFGRGARSFRDTLEQAAPALEPGKPARARERKQRPPQECVIATPAGPDGILLDLKGRPLPVGESVRVAAHPLAMPLLLARVSERHLAAVTGVCPLDASDLLWSHGADRVACPSCASLWRLDGAPTRGPARHALRSFPVSETAGLATIRTA